MWYILGIRNFILRKEILDGVLTVYLSDFIRIFNVSLKNDEILAIAKEMNPLIEAPKLKLIEKVILLLDEIKTVNKKLEENDTYMILHLDSNMSGIKFHFQLKLEIQNGDLLFKKITLPFILLASRLQVSQNKLIEVIREKEAEIDEYKRENFSIKRTQLITKPFDLKEMEEQEEDPLTTMIVHNPSSVFDIINSKTFENIASFKCQNNETNDMNLEGNTQSNGFNSKHVYAVEPSKNEKKSKFNKKVRSKIEIQINSSYKRKSVNHRVPLKF